MIEQIKNNINSNPRNLTRTLDPFITKYSYEGDEISFDITQNRTEQGKPVYKSVIKVRNQGPFGDPVSAELSKVLFDEVEFIYSMTIEKK